MAEPQSSEDAHTGKDASKEKEGRDMVDILLSILDVLRKSSIANLDVIDPIQRFWKHYKTTADEFDDELLDKLRQDIDMSMIFAGLFSAVDATVISMTNANLSQDPNVITQALLQSVVFSLNASAIATPLVPTTPVWNGPSATAIWVQSLLYISLACSLYAALASMLGKQWLSHYRSVGERGDHKARGAERHRKFIGLEAWHLRAILGSIPLLLQISLLLFGLGSCAYVWDQQRIVGAITIVANGIGALCYFAAVGISVLYPESPFQTPLTTFLVHLTKACRSAWQFCLHNISPPASYLKPTWLQSLAVIRSLRQWLARCLRPLTQCLQRLLCRTREPEDTNRDEERADKHPEDQPDSRKSLVMSDITVTTGENNEKYTEADEVLTSAMRWLSITTTDLQVQAAMWPVIPMVCWSPRAMQELPIEILDRILVDIRSCFEVDNEGKLTLILRHREIALSAISVFLFLFWEKLADSFEETKEWVHNAHTRRILHPFIWLNCPGLPDGDELQRSNRALTETLVYLEEFAENSMEDKQSHHLLHPVVSIRSSSYIGFDIIRARAMFYLAQQATPPSWDATLGASKWDIGELAEHRRVILDRLLVIVSDADSVPALVVFALASAVAVHFGSPISSNQSPSTYKEPEILKLACQAVHDALKDLANTLCLPSQNAIQQGLVVAPSPQSIWLNSEHSRYDQDPQLNKDLVLSFLESLQSLSILQQKRDLPGQDKMRSLINSKIPELCLEIFMTVIPNVSQDESQMLRIAGELLLLGIPPACCPYHEAGMETSEVCQVSSKWVPKHGAYQRLVSAAESAAQDFQTLANHILVDYAYYGVNPSLGHYYSTILFLSLSGLFSTTLCTSQTSRYHALHVIQKTALRAATSEPGYEDARIATSLIHSLLKPAQADMLPATEDFIHLSNNAFCTGIQVLLLKSCSEPFYKSADNFLGPDEITSDILLWLGGPSFAFADAQWRKTCMPVWIHIAKRALVTHYRDSSRPYWLRPSDYLPRNLCRLIAYDRLFGIQGAVAAGAAGKGEQHTEGLDADGGDPDADFWSSDDVRCITVTIVELQLGCWYWQCYTDEDLAPHLVLDRIECALAQLQSKHIEQVKDHLVWLKIHIHDFHQYPTKLFAEEKRTDEAVKKAAVECVPILTVLEAMLTPLPEESPGADVEVTDVPAPS